ncbi:MAG: YegS/Rv2252/BmrU family lipid kinase [Lentisphaeria bacterium]|nr:YegS/Rv2252/BmrU family lipid kinase [Lentisphaeria bacterium]
MNRRRFIIIIANPAAGRRRRRRLDSVLGHLQEMGAEVRIMWTRREGDGTDRALAAVQEQPDLIVAAGGDGTINEVLNGMAYSGIPLGFLPLGTANVLAVETGMPSRPDRLAALLLNGETLTVRPGRVAGAAGHLFLLMAGAGLDAEAIDQLCPKTKRRIGKGAYARAIVDRLRKRPLSHIEITVDGEPLTGCFAVISKSRCYGGAFALTPDASLAADTFEVCVFSPANRFRLLWQLAAVRFGGHLTMKDVRTRRGEHVLATCPEESFYQTDGDLRGPLPAEFTLSDVTLPLVCPAPFPRTSAGA